MSNIAIVKQPALYSLFKFQAESRELLKQGLMRDVVIFAEGYRAGLTSSSESCIIKYFECESGNAIKLQWTPVEQLKYEVPLLEQPTSRHLEFASKFQDTSIVPWKPIKSDVQFSETPGLTVNSLISELQKLPGHLFVVHQLHYFSEAVTRVFIGTDDPGTDYAGKVVIDGDGGRLIHRKGIANETL